MKHAFGIDPELLEALDLQKQTVQGIAIRLAPDDFTYIDVSFVPTKEQVSRVRQWALEKHKPLPLLAPEPAQESLL